MEYLSLMRNVAFDQMDEFRASFNKNCAHLEAWQIVSYTVSFCLFAMWFRRHTRSNQSIMMRTKSLFYMGIRSLPWVRRRLQADMERAQKEIEEEIHQFDQLRDFYKFLPERSLGGDELVSEAKQYSLMGERRYMEHYDPRTREADRKVCAKIYDMFSHSDPHRSDAFPGVRKMEAEIVKMCSAVLHAGVDSSGTVASGGTESTLLACLAYRNRALSEGIRLPEIIAPSTAHPSVDKAASLFGMRVIRVSVDNNNRVDVDAVQSAISSGTCMIFASAPNHITGTVDPIEKLANLAQRYDLPLHIDCTLGGFILPFMEHSDYNVPAFDFRLPGVSSISIDLHRYGQCPRSCSVLLFRDRSMLRYQCFLNNSWAGGSYATPTLAGGRDGGAVATAWATLLRKGRDGYIDACHRVVDTTRQLAEQIKTLQGFHLQGSADICVVAFSTDHVDVYALVDIMTRKGWHVDALQSPVAARIGVTLSMCEEDVIDTLVDDLESCVQILTDRQKSGTGGKSRTASYYHMLHSIADRSIVDELSLMRLQAHYSIPVGYERRNTRTLSVEGRKMSMMAAADALRVVQEMRRKEAQPLLE